MDKATIKHGYRDRYGSAYTQCSRLSFPGALRILLVLVTAHDKKKEIKLQYVSTWSIIRIKIDFIHTKKNKTKHQN